MDRQNTVLTIRGEGTDSVNCTLDWQASYEEFLKQVRDLIATLKENARVIPLPFYGGDNSAIVFISQIKCDGCDAHCCTENPEGKPLALMPGEFERMVAASSVFQDNAGVIKLPCPALKDNRCTIYKDRPLKCLYYPIQDNSRGENGLHILSVNSNCPEACRIAEQVYMIQWAFNRSLGFKGG